MKRSAIALRATPYSVPLDLLGQEKATHESMITSTPQWEKVKTLIGDGKATSSKGQENYDVHFGAHNRRWLAVMHWMGAGTPEEMMMMFHMDKTERSPLITVLRSTSQGCGPCLRARPTEVAFDFKDGTNIRPGDGYMKQLAITFVDADHHDETWGYDNNGKIESVTFYMTRVKQSRE